MIETLPLETAAIDIDDTLPPVFFENVPPMIETVPLAQAADAYARTMAGKARFGMVLDKLQASKCKRFASANQWGYA